MKKMITVDELMEQMSISRAFAYQLVHEKGFPAAKIGGKILISTAMLDKWIEEQIEKNKA